MEQYAIDYYSEKVQKEILQLPSTIQAKYWRFLDLMKVYGPNLGLPHTKSMSNGLFELRIKGAEGIARVFYCTMIHQKIVMLHSFIKKTMKTPPKELLMANKRMKEIKNG